MRRILVVRAGALGDGLLTLPALAALRTARPSARLTLVGPRSLLPFAAAAGLADSTLPIEDAAGLALVGAAEAAPPWANADLAVLWLQRWHEGARRLEQWGIRQVLAGPALPATDQQGHVADHLFRLLAPCDIGPSRLARPLPVPAGAAVTAAAWWQAHLPSSATSVIAVHPGSGGRQKCWPLDRFAALVRRLADSGRHVLICLGPAEVEEAARRQQFLDTAPGATVAIGLDIAVLAGVLRGCAAFIGNDSGVTHLAAALGVPTLAIFGPSDPLRWAPLGRRARVLRDPGFQRSVSGPAGAWSLQPPELEQTVQDLLASPDDPATDTES